MRLLASFVCDAASVRENLGHILGAGISRVSSQRFPFSLSVDFFALLEVSGVGNRPAIDVALALRKSGDSEALAEITGTLDFPEIQRTGAPSVNVPISFPLKLVVVPEPGKYEFVLSIPGLEPVVVPITMASANGDAEV